MDNSIKKINYLFLNSFLEFALEGTNLLIVQVLITNKILKDTVNNGQIKQCNQKWQFTSENIEIKFSMCYALSASLNYIKKIMFQSLIIKQPADYLYKDNTIKIRAKFSKFLWSLPVFMIKSPILMISSVKHETDLITKSN